MTQEARDVSAFLKIAAAIKADWFPDDTEPFGPWFRGHQQVHWPLRPKLCRDYGSYAEVSKHATEDELREEFIIRAPALSEVPLIATGEWDWYFLMQHFGAPTRLLDWTEGALIALYFAVRDNPGFYDAAVWVLDPHVVNKRAIGTEQVIPPSATGVLRQKESKNAARRGSGHRGVEVDRDPLGSPMEPLPMAVDDMRGERAAHRIERLRPDVIFEARDRRLRGERVPVDRNGISGGSLLRPRSPRTCITSIWTGRLTN